MAANPQKNVTSWASNDGSFKRQTSAFRDVVTPSSQGGKFPAEKGRYYLYVSLACPWAHRALIARKLKGLEDIIQVAIVHPHMGSNSWSFTGEGYEGQGLEQLKDGKIPNIIPDPLYNFTHLRQLYFKADPNYGARFTVPTFWDSKTETIVNNESSEIIRFMNTAFDELIEPKYKGVTYYPEDLRAEIDSLNEWVYPNINNGVYRSGFATKQEPYLQAVTELTDSLKRIEGILQGKEYLIGERLTEADIRLFTTIVRYDAVYVVHFKCNGGTIRHDFPNINRWLKNLYWKNPAFHDTTDFNHIKIHYYTSHPQINPNRIVPLGPLPPVEPIAPQ